MEHFLRKLFKWRFHWKETPSISAMLLNNIVYGIHCYQLQVDTKYGLSLFKHSVSSILNQNITVVYRNKCLKIKTKCFLNILYLKQKRRPFYFSFMLVIWHIQKVRPETRNFWYEAWELRSWTHLRVVTRSSVPETLSVALETEDVQPLSYWDPRLRTMNLESRARATRPRTLVVGWFWDTGTLIGLKQTTLNMNLQQKN